MRVLISGLLSLMVLFFFSVSTVIAHTAGQVPFFKVDGVFSSLYPVPTTSLNDFRLPQDDSPDLYLVNTPIEFELDGTRLPIPAQILEDTTFIWDFGDGNKKSGKLHESYAYTKSGSYVLEITAKTKLISEPQLIQSTLIQVVPAKPYQLPKSVIHVNGEGVKDPLLDIVKLEFGNNFSLDGTTSSEGSGKIVSYFWDLGDGKSANNPKLAYSYKPEQYAYFPVLRVTDENGLFSDSFLQVTNTLNENESLSKSAQNRNMFNAGNFIYLILGGFILIILWGVSFPLRKRFYKRR